MNLKNLIIRSLGGGMYAVLIIGGIIFSQWSFVIMGAVLALLASREFLVMTKPGGNKLNISVDVLFAVCAVVLSLVSITGICPQAMQAVLKILVPSYLLVRPIIQLYNQKEEPIKSIAYSFYAQCYTLIPLLFMGWIYNEMNEPFLLLIFAMIWLNDTGAFLVGCLIGKRRLFERISPKKSWEGFWGGVVFSIATGVAYYYLIGEAPEGFNNLPFYIILGALVSASATYGDLVESMFKRSIGVKDSGNLIPGHGGILDRIDSLLFVFPTTALYLYIYSAI